MDIIVTIAILILFVYVWGKLDDKTQRERREREKETFYTFCYFKYQKIDGEIIIIKCNKPNKEVDIPEAIYGLPVVEIGDNAFARCSSMTKVKIPSRVKKIGRGAFNRCPMLTIYGKTGSYVQQYAFDHKIPFADASKF